MRGKFSNKSFHSFQLYLYINKSKHLYDFFELVISFMNKELYRANSYRNRGNKSMMTNSLSSPIAFVTKAILQFPMREEVERKKIILGKKNS